jgi:hypothetical protein
MTKFAFPDRKALLHVYHELDKKHPHDLLPLETALRRELQPEKRDKDRIAMTMILSGANSDRRLAVCLGKLFRRHPDFQSLRNLNKEGVERLLGKEPPEIGLGHQNPDRGGNGDRLWSFLEYCSGPREGTITEANILALRDKKGFGDGKFVRALQAYCCGNRDVLPLDQQVLDAIRDPLFPGSCDRSDEEIRNDIETKLSGESGVSLLDFHELLRFVEQDSRAKTKQAKEGIIIGWNEWRLLCSLERATITEEWIRNNLIRDRGIAHDLWDFFQGITGQRAK